MNSDAVRQAVRDLLLALGEDPDRPELVETPRRVAESYAELLAGYASDAAGMLQPLPGDGIADGEAVVISHLAFRSMCEHHLLPFRGTAHVVYAPGESVAGFGSFARALETLATRLQVQERLTGQFADAVESGLGARGVLVVMEASHGCMADRGARQTDARATTMASRGIYRDAQRRSEALRLIPVHTSPRSDPWLFDGADALAPLDGILPAAVRS
ncbi:GTP cyclohydrolase I [Agromyces sp. Marseille-P2726]|uniref:GTP cyclohydrolase I n=1 Tax=Agromyces sp. Marseille-P2726 TaxID=2709132 RepID=UPI00157100E3|nr:GTP cyclohydrolase I [Agromyces sp. Marseille-P2726]